MNQELRCLSLSLFLSHSLSAEISLHGEKYLDKQINDAVKGVKEMKKVIQRSSDDRKDFLDALEKTKVQKEVIKFNISGDFAAK